MSTAWPDEDMDGSAARLVREALAYADGLHNLARHLSQNATQAEDLVQETYARALGAAAQFTEGSNLRAWLYRILRNTFIDLYRREHRARTDGGLDTVVDENAPVVQGNAEPDQMRAVVGHEIEQAMMVLTDDARMAVLLDLEGGPSRRSRSAWAARREPSNHVCSGRARGAAGKAARPWQMKNER